MAELQILLACPTNDLVTVQGEPILSHARPVMARGRRFMGPNWAIEWYKALTVGRVLSSSTVMLAPITFFDIQSGKLSAFSPNTWKVRCVPLNARSHLRKY